MMLRIFKGKFKPFRQREFVEYFSNQANIDKFNSSMPEGIKLIGAYLVEMGQADHHFELVYELSGYGALDRWRMNNPEVKAGFQEFISHMGFFAQDTSEHYLRSVDDVTLLDKDVVDAVAAKEKERAS